MGKMSELYIKIMEEKYNKLAEEKKQEERLREIEKLYTEKNCDNSL